MIDEEIREIARKRAIEIGERREEVLEAFIAKYGYEPDEMMIIENTVMGSFQVVRSPKWVSVKEGVPEKDIQVLCYGERLKNIHDDGLPYKTGIYDGENWISDHFCESYSIDVTHWMPLPEPPK